MDHVESKPANVNFNRNGQGRVGTKLTLPLNWVRAMGLTEDDKAVQLNFDGEVIYIQKAD